jgi:hypothetical protein
VCTVGECCEKAKPAEPPLCTTFGACPSLMHDAARKSTLQCAGAVCIKDDCCVANPTCTASVCPPSTHTFDKQRRFSKCKGTECAVGECCTAHPVCDAKVCRFGTHSFNGNTRPCASMRCTPQECCEKHETCADVDLCAQRPHAKANGQTGACGHAKCVFDDCCVVEPPAAKACSAHACTASGRVHRRDAASTTCYEREGFPGGALCSDDVCCEESGSSGGCDIYAVGVNDGSCIAAAACTHSGRVFRRNHCLGAQHGRRVCCYSPKKGHVAPSSTGYCDIPALGVKDGSCVPKDECDGALGLTSRAGFCPRRTHGNNLCCFKAEHRSTGACASGKAAGGTMPTMVDGSCEPRASCTSSGRLFVRNKCPYSQHGQNVCCY